MRRVQNAVLAVGSVGRQNVISQFGPHLRGSVAADPPIAADRFDRERTYLKGDGEGTEALATSAIEANGRLREGVGRRRPGRTRGAPGREARRAWTCRSARATAEAGVELQWRGRARKDARTIVEAAEPQALEGLHPCPDLRDSQQLGRPVTHRLCGRHVSPLDDPVRPRGC